MNRAEAKALPDGREQRSFLYAVAREDGAIKIGCTRSPKTRIECLFDALTRAGHRMTGAYVIETKRHTFTAERDALSSMVGVGSVMHGTREWFTGCYPQQVVSVLHAAATSPAESGA